MSVAKTLFCSENRSRKKRQIISVFTEVQTSMRPVLSLSSEAQRRASVKISKIDRCWIVKSEDMLIEFILKIIEFFSHYFLSVTVLRKCWNFKPSKFWGHLKPWCCYKLGFIKTRPDTRQSSRGRLGRSSNAKTNRNSEMWRTDRRTDRHGKV